MGWAVYPVSDAAAAWDRRHRPWTLARRDQVRRLRALCEDPP
jgi:hypothetical protein